MTKHDPAFDSRVRLAHLGALADSLHIEAVDLGQKRRDTRTEIQNLEARRDELEARTGPAKDLAADEAKRLNEKIEGLKLDLASLDARYERIGAEHQVARATYNAALARAKELGLPVPVTDIAARDFGTPGTPKPYDDGNTKKEGKK